MTENQEKKIKKISGVVVSTKMKDTATVLVDRFVKHPKYKKFIKSSKKFQVHDPENTAKIGDKVEITQSKPVSKIKKFKLVK